MKKKFFMGIALMFAYSLVVMLLLNWLRPITSLPHVNYFQALAIKLICNLLFKTPNKDEEMDEWFKTWFVKKNKIV